MIDAVRLRGGKCRFVQLPPAGLMMSVRPIAAMLELTARGAPQGVRPTESCGAKWLRATVLEVGARACPRWALMRATPTRLDFADPSCGARGQRDDTQQLV